MEESASAEMWVQDAKDLSGGEEEVNLLGERGLFGRAVRGEAGQVGETQ